MNFNTLNYNFFPLAADHCVCGQLKPPGVPFCQACEESLPQHLIRDMIHPLADYGDAYERALRWMEMEISE